MARAVLVVLASLFVLTACGQLKSLLQDEEQREPSPEQAGTQDSSPTSQKSDPKGVGNTAEVGSFLVTLNDAKAHSFDAQGDGANNHYYAVADLTLENSAEAPVDAAKAEFLLRDEEGYSFEKKSITEQKPQPEGQVMPGDKASGEVTFDLGTEPVKGPLSLIVSFSGQPDVTPAAFEFELKLNAQQEGDASSSVESAYKVIEDPTGSLSVEVPHNWEADIGTDSEAGGGPNSWSYYAGETITASITTARSLNDWKYTGEPTSGTYMVASRTLAQEYTDDELIHSLLLDGKGNRCTAGPYEDFDRPPYFGKMQRWYDCGANDNTSLVVAAAPADRACVVVLDVIVSSEADREAVEHILDTFEVDCGTLPAPPPAEAQTSTSASATATATSTPATDEPQAISCDDFVAYASGTPSQWQAQQFYDFQATPAEQAALDPDGDGFACEGASTDTDSGGTPESTATPSLTADPTAEPSTDPTSEPSAVPGGGDIDCDQVDGPIYVGPNDPHNLDGDGDGYACEE